MALKMATFALNYDDANLLQLHQRKQRERVNNKYLCSAYI